MTTVTTADLGSEVSHGMVGMTIVPGHVTHIVNQAYYIKVPQFSSYTLSPPKYWSSKSEMASLEPSLLASAMASSLSYSVACHCRY